MVLEGLVFMPEMKADVQKACIVTGNTFKYIGWLRTMTAQSLGLPRGQGAEWRPAIGKKGAWYIPTNVFPPEGTIECDLLSGKVKPVKVKPVKRKRENEECTGNANKRRIGKPKSGYTLKVDCIGKRDWKEWTHDKIIALCTADKPYTDPIMAKVSKDTATDYLSYGSFLSMLGSLGRANGDIPQTIHQRWKEYIDDVFERKPYTPEYLRRSHIRVHGHYCHKEDAQDCLSDAEKCNIPTILLGEDLELLNTVSDVSAFIERLIIRSYVRDYRTLCGHLWGLLWLIPMVESLSEETCSFPPPPMRYPHSEPLEQSTLDQMESWDVEERLMKYELFMVIDRLRQITDGLHRQVWYTLLGGIYERAL